MTSLLTGPYTSYLPKVDGSRASLTPDQQDTVSAVFGSHAGYADVYAVPCTLTLNRAFTIVCVSMVRGVNHANTHPIANV